MILQLLSIYKANIAHFDQYNLRYQTILKMKGQSKNNKCKPVQEQPPTPNKRKQMQSPSYTNASLLESSRPTQQYLHEQNDKKASITKKKTQKSNATSQQTTQKPQPVIQIQENTIPVELEQVSIPNDEAYFGQNILIGVRYSIIRPLEENLKWKLIYLGSAFSEKHDQVLLDFETPDTQRSIQSTKREFKLECMPPKIDLIPPQQLFSISAIVLSVSYKNQEFARVGFYIHYQLPSLQPSQQQQIDKFQGKPIKNIKQQSKQDSSNNKTQKKSKKIIKQKSGRPTKILAKFNSKQEQGVNSLVEKVVRKTLRTILVDKPRVIKFQIQWQNQQEKIAEQFDCNEQMEIQNEFNSILQDQHQITQYFTPISRNQQKNIFEQSLKTSQKPQTKITRIINTWTFSAQGDVICQNVERYFQ